MNTQNKSNKMILLGFDGTSWNVLSPLLKSGKMPNFEKLMSGGMYANLRTPEPPFTPIIWTTILSGVEAKRHGIKTFFNTQEDLLVPRLWDILMSEGKSAGVVGHYFTYPINKKLDYCIPSHFDRGVETSPDKYQFIREITHMFESREFSVKKLAHNFIAAVKNGLSFGTLAYGIRSILSMLLHRDYYDWQHRIQRIFLDISFDAFLHAYQTSQPDFASFYSPLPDTICHKYWCFYEPEHFSDIQPKQIEKYGKVIEETYMHIDKLLGKLLERIPSDTQICIVSDHGFQKMDYSKDRLVLVPEKLMKVLNLESEITITNLGHQILIQPKKNAGSNDVLNRLSKTLKESRDLETDFHIFDDILMDDNTQGLYCRIYYELGNLDSTIILNGREMKMSEIAKIGASWTGRHHMEEGVFFISGEGVRSKGRRDIVEAADIAPTLLRLQGCLVADDLNGYVMDDVIDPDWAKENPGRRIGSYDGIVFKSNQNGKDVDNEEEVTKQLKSLGYM